MDDLLSEKGQKEAEEFFEYVCWNMENGFSETAPKKLSAPKNVPVSVLENTETE